MAKKITITHNPFTVTTGILINGQEPADGSPLAIYKEQRLQSWVETLPDILQQTFNGESDYDIHFTGTESDWLDVEEVINNANDKKGMAITLHMPERFAETGEVRLKKLIALKEEAEREGYLDFKDGDFQETFRDALDKDFDVFVVATMSSGKSTLINAMLWQDLLPTANEATTATIVEIIDNDAMEDKGFKAVCLDDNGKELDMYKEFPVTRETLSKWNRDNQVCTIRLEGNIPGIREKPYVRLRLTDTPGPNNSQNDQHEKTTMRAIKDDRKNPLILYVLNGMHLTAVDDKRLLNMVSENMAKGGKQNKDRFLFVANKMDEFFNDKENIKETINNAKSYLNENKIDSPNVFPVSGRFALLQRNEKSLSDDERDDMNAMKSKSRRADDRDMEKHMPLSSRIKKHLDDREIDPTLRRSGVPALESVIENYIDKYCFPYRVDRAYSALKKAVEKAVDRQSLEEHIHVTEAELTKIQDEIEALKARKEKGLLMDEHKKKIKNKALPKSVEMFIFDISKNLEERLKILGKNLTGSVGPNEAKDRLKKAEKELVLLLNEIIVSYDEEYRKTHMSVYRYLKESFEKYVASLFPENGDLEMKPLADSIKKNLGNISLNMKLKGGDIEIVSIYKKRAWCNPKRWFGDALVKVGERESVDLTNLWKKRATEVSSKFETVKQEIQKNMEDGHKDLLENYLDFLEKVFNPAFDALIAELEQKISDKNKREDAYHKSRQALEWLDGFDRKMQSVVSL